MDSFAATSTGTEPAARLGRFFERDGQAFVPQEVSRSPWNPRATNGLAVAGLLMHRAEQVEAPAPMLPAHVTIDILRPVPFAPTLTGAAVTRAGRKMQMVESYLLADGEAVARARVLRVREQASPHVAAPLPFPSPEAGPQRQFLDGVSPLGDAVETLQVAGSRETLGAGTIWTRFRYELAPGVPVEGVVHAAMLSDFGNGVSRPVDPAAWSFANLDISLHLVRRPLGEWLLVDADSMVQGLGVGLSNMRLADRAGVFGQAHQTMFIDPR